MVVLGVVDVFDVRYFPGHQRLTMSHKQSRIQLQ